MQRIYDNYRDQADFYVVYIAEAHAVNEWQTDSNTQAGIEILQHETFADRLSAAHLCKKELSLTIPTVVDQMDDAASHAFAAFPERIFIVGTDQTLAYCGGPGPFEFNPAEAEQALASIISK